jgi:hypothetical protein
MPGVLTVSHRLAAEGGAKSEWLELLPDGAFRSVDGSANLRVTRPQAVIAASLQHGPVLVDVNYATRAALVTGQPAPAMARIGMMDVRGGAIWGLIDWTEDGRRLVSEHSYRDISIALEADASGLVQRLLCAALTNSPTAAGSALLNNRGSVGVTYATSLNHVSVGSHDTKPTDIEREIARHMGQDPNTLARERQRRSAATVTSVVTHATSFEHDIDGSKNIKPSEIEREVGRRLGTDPNALAQRRAGREAEAKEAGIDVEGFRRVPRPTPSGTSGHLKLTDAQADACRKVGINPDEYLQYLKDQESLRNFGRA